MKSDRQVVAEKLGKELPAVQTQRIMDYLESPRSYHILSQLRRYPLEKFQQLLGNLSAEVDAESWGFPYIQAPPASPPAAAAKPKRKRKVPLPRFRPIVMTKEKKEILMARKKEVVVTFDTIQYPPDPYIDQLDKKSTSDFSECFGQFGVIEKIWLTPGVRGEVMVIFRDAQAAKMAENESPLQMKDSYVYARRNDSENILLQMARREIGGAHTLRRG